MEHRLSERISDLLTEYLSEAAIINQESVITTLETLDAGAQAAQENKAKKDDIQLRYKAITDAEKEKMLQEDRRLQHELSIVSNLEWRLGQVYPVSKVNFANVPDPGRSGTLDDLRQRTDLTIQRIKDTTFTGGLKKLVGYDGWQSNNDAAGELWLRLQDARTRREQEIDALLPRFEAFCKKQAAIMGKEQDKVNDKLSRTLNEKTAANKSAQAGYEARKKKLMGDPRVKKAEGLLAEVGPLMGAANGWEHYTPAKSMPEELLMARSLMLSEVLQAYNWHPDSKQTAGDYLDPFARQFSFYNPKVKGFIVPETFLVNYYLILWAETDGDMSGPAGLYRDIVLRQMRFMPTKSTRSFFIDPKGLGQNMRELIKLTKEQGGSGVCTLVTQAGQVEKTMAELRQHVTRVRQTLTVTGMVDTTQYNAQPGVKGKIPYTTLVIHDFPCGFSNQALDDLRTVIDQANDCGFTILISRNKDEKLEDKARELFYNSEKGRRLEYRGDKCVFHDGDFHLPLRRLEVNVSDDFLREFNEAYSYKPPVKNGFFDIMDSSVLTQPFQTDSTQELRFPFAVDSQGRVQELVLDSDLKSYGLIIGGTGAGKTSLLHTIINSAALHYSPQELELWLIDYKLTSFDFYKHNRLPQVRHIVMDETDVLTYSVVDELRIEYARRQRLFKQAAAKDFAEYRAKGHKLPRLLVLVDETHLMSQALMDDGEYKQHMQNIIAQARYTGINILFADQKFSALNGFAGCMSNMYVRISLKNELEQVKQTLDVFNLNSLDEAVAASIQSMPAAAAGTMIYKHEERNPDDPTTKLVRYDHISCLYAPTDAYIQAVQAAQVKAGAGDFPCQVYEGPTRLRYDIKTMADYEQRDPQRPNEGDRFYIGSPRGMGRCFRMSIKPEDEGENILLVGGQNELRMPLVANSIRNALRHRYRVVVLVPRASMFYKKNKELIQSLVDQFESQVDLYTEYPQICRYIGQQANLLRSLDEDDGEDMPEAVKTLVVCLGTDDLYKKMEDDPNTQQKAWAGLEQESKSTQQAEEKKEGFDFDALAGNIDQMLAQLSQEPSLAQLLGGLEDSAAQPQPEPVAQPAPQTQQEGTALQGYNATGDWNILIRDGWKLSIHTLLAVNSTNGLKNMSRIKLSGNFNHRLALPMAPEQGSAFLYNTKALKAMADEADIMGAVYEYMGGNGQRFIPYL